MLSVQASAACHQLHENKNSGFHAAVFILLSVAKLIFQLYRGHKTFFSEIRFRQKVFV
jgi:hypothetical protein